MRKFKCIGLIEDFNLAWNIGFKVGLIYNEGFQDGRLDSAELYLINDYGGLYVDADQFEEVKEADDE